MAVKPLDPFDCIVFGATGDLTLRKLLPALYYRYRDGQIPGDARIIGAARSELTDDNFRARAAEALKAHVAKPDHENKVVDRFLTLLHYARGDAAKPGGLAVLKTLLADQPTRVRVFYMATSPDLYGPTCENLQKSGLVTPNSRVVLEKPIGHDLASAKQINDVVGHVFSEAQIFRIDHYLGKETVQNLMALRFANVVFERLWNADVIDHVQITVGETVGVEGRGDYYDKLRRPARHGAEPPAAAPLPHGHGTPRSASRPTSLRDEKLKVLRALKPIAPHEVGHVTVRGQYSQRRRRRQSRPGLPRRPRPRPHQPHRDLRRRQSRNPELALGRRPLLSPLRQAPARRRSARSSCNTAARPVQHLRPQTPANSAPTSSSSASNPRKA